MAGSEKTNVIRTLERLKVPCREHCYLDSGAVAGVDVANALGEDPRRVFKTLVTVGRSGKYYVFMIPVAQELNLKKAASAAGEKSIEMIKARDLLPLTGYVHGGCSPIGMKKPFRTFIHCTAEGYDTLFFSAGKIGYQAECSLEGLRKALPVECADLTD